MTHTKGKCEIEEDDYSCGTEYDLPCYLPSSIFCGDVEIANLAALHDDGQKWTKESIEIIKANARRIVALWNAAAELDLDTGQIERGIIDDAFTALKEKVDEELYASYLKEMTP